MEIISDSDYEENEELRDRELIYLKLEIICFSLPNIYCSNAPFSVFGWSNVTEYMELKWSLKSQCITEGFEFNWRKYSYLMIFIYLFIGCAEHKIGFYKDE